LLVAWVFAGCYSVGAWSPYKREGGGSKPPAPTRRPSDLHGCMPGRWGCRWQLRRAAKARAAQVTLRPSPDLAKRGAEGCYSSQ
jgi:hypothetical protein